ncbi:hypothetical protein HPP92_004582 [Vanilla planifolia]|uniref:MRN complex-interacting protein N-terminal domain-containing protein n=1 Tax=Vanilla planifolia TaxID=51239 RepID=A0A835S4P2_VANPL|nr:hypothetical protein HPP92_004582 [Vanilla planifolia]
MPILFIAVQCVQCSTMQIKQQKKSSNKWTCAICNQKQSMRRIHGRSYLARDLRHFVQEFNLSRMRLESDAGQPFLSPPTEECRIGAEDKGECPSKRRMDWSEYLDHEVEDEEQCVGGENPYPASQEAINEMPRKMLNVEEKMAPFMNLSKRRDFNPDGLANVQKRKCVVVREGSSKWKEYFDEEEEEHEEGEDQSNVHSFEGSIRVDEEIT